jgi:ferric-dicitrate binding protein FerR (iron transport regulator)
MMRRHTRLFFPFLGVILVLLFIPATLRAQAVASYVLGEVSVQRGSSRLPADIGMDLLEGDTIHTGADGLAIISVDGRADLKMRENSVLTLSDIGERITVDLDQGGLFSRVRSAVGRNFNVRAQTVVAGVRGTEFFVAYGRTIEDAPDVWLCVNDGAVDVEVPGADPVVVNAGEGINILSSSRITEPRFYPWTRGLNWNVDPNAGSVVDDTDLDAAYSDLLDQDYD